MKYRLIAVVIFAIIVLIATFYIQPMLNTDNQLINLAYVVSLFVVGAILGYIGRRLDSNSCVVILATQRSYKQLFRIRRKPTFRFSNTLTY